MEKRARNEGLWGIVPEVRFLAYAIINTIGIAVAAQLVSGVHVEGAHIALLAGVILGAVNMLVKPVLILLTLPFTLVTFGLFLFVVNAICLGLAAAVVPGFALDGFWSALLGALVVSVVSWVLNRLFMRERP